jgi:VIT1/CCC1 family predicted Fe2+/Mn2+ transporter
MVDALKKICRLKETRFSFGATAAIITNLGLIAGLRTGEHAKISIITGMLLIALADNISDSMGIHIYQETECIEPREVWLSTFTNFMSRLLVSLTFILLVVFLPMNLAAVCSIIWGLLLLAMMSYAIARDRKINPYLTILEHLSIAAAVIIASNFAGRLLITKFKFLS